MKRYVILSTNDNPKYIFYVPLVCWGWRKIGWEPVILYDSNGTKLSDQAVFNLVYENSILDEWYALNDIEGYKSETVTQCSRIYASRIKPGYLMTSDADMLPLSDYWHPDENKFTSWGRDLTDYHFPICYLGADSELWQTIMKIGPDQIEVYMKRDLRQQKNMWELDQDIITERILAYGKNRIKHIDRGTDKRTGYPIGRVDRSHWTLKHDVFIDAHLPHDILTNEKSYQNVLELVHHIWPNENFEWFEKYYQEFKKLL